MSDVACPLSDVAMVPDRIYSNVITVSAIVIPHPISSCADSGGARNFVDNLREVSSHLALPFALILLPESESFSGFRVGRGTTLGTIIMVLYNRACVACAAAFRHVFPGSKAAEPATQHADCETAVSNITVMGQNPCTTSGWRATP